MFLKIFLHWSQLFSFFFAITCHFKKYISVLFNPENRNLGSPQNVPQEVDVPETRRDLMKSISGNCYFHKTYYYFLKRQYSPSPMYHNAD